MSLINFPINITIWIFRQSLTRPLKKTINCSYSRAMASELKVTTVMNEVMGFFHSTTWTHVFNRSGNLNQKRDCNMTNEWNCKPQRAGLRGGHSRGAAMNWWCWCFDKQIDHRKPELGAGSAALPARLYLEKTANLPPEFCEPDWWNRYFKPIPKTLFFLAR